MYTTIFIGQKIDGQSFMELTKIDLKEMNIEIGPQKIILKLIEKLTSKQQNDKKVVSYKQVNVKLYIYFLSICSIN